MAILVHRYDSPDRFVAGTVGQPGERTFFLQAREGNRITSVVVEKQQVSVLADHLERVLEEILKRSRGEAEVPPPVSRAEDTSPLDAPITEEFRVGTMTIAWDPEASKVVIELFSNDESADDEPTGPDDLEEAGLDDTELLGAAEVSAEEMIVVKISPAYARDFIARAQALVAAGRPACPFCLQPIDPDGHICPRANGYRRPLF